MSEKCPRCGSFDIELLPDRSGMCRQCGRAFIEPAPEDAVIPDEFRARSTTETPAPPYLRRKFASDSDMAPRYESFGAVSTDLELAQLSYFERKRRMKRDRLRWGGFLAYTGAPFFVISIIVAITLMLVIFSEGAGRPVSLDELFAAFDEIGALGLLYLGILLQIIFFIVALALGFCMRGNVKWAAPGAVAFGILAMVTSFVFFGGIVGAVGGILVLVGGVLGTF